MKLAIVFPGQGSQAVGMMQAYGESATIRDTFDEASSVLGRDLWQLVSEGPAEALSQTVNTQPLMLTAGVAVYRAWLQKGGPEPAMVAGHSLGEYTALVAAGSLDFADALPLVQFRAQVMQEAVPQGEGAMAAILGLDDDSVRAACADAAQGQVVEPVNFNDPHQTVIAGNAAAVARAAALVKAKGAKRAVMLPVSAPFHCSLMAPAAARLEERLAATKMRKPSIPLFNNVDVACYEDPDAIKDALVRQARSPVRWVEIIRAMAAHGATHVFELGPGKVLGRLTQRIEHSLQGGAIADAASLDHALTAVK